MGKSAAVACHLQQGSKAVVAVENSCRVLSNGFGNLEYAAEPNSVVAVATRHCFTQRAAADPGLNFTEAQLETMTKLQTYAVLTVIRFCPRRRTWLTNRFALCRSCTALERE